MRMNTSTRIRLATTLGAMLLATSAQSASLLVNGSFEATTAGGTVFNPLNAEFNALMSGVTAYGARQGIDIQTLGSGYGQAPQNGAWKVSPASDAGGTTEEFSLAMTGPLIVGESYQLSFYIERLTQAPFNGGTVQIGVSSSATSFGTQVALATAPNSGWLLSNSSFLAPIAASYLTVRLTTTQSSWVGLDNFTLTGAAPVPEAGSAALLAAGLAVVGGLQLRRRRAD
jgi:hypothetical protein